MHTVDYISRLDPPPLTARLSDNRGNRTVAMYALCSTNSFNNAGVDETMLLQKPQNKPGARIANFTAAVDLPHMWTATESHSFGTDRYSVSLRAGSPRVEVI